MTAHNSSRSQYTPITTASDVSIEPCLSNPAAVAKDTQTSNPDPSSSITDAEKTKVENKDKEDGNGRYEKVRRPSPRDTDVIFGRDSDAGVEPVSELDFETNSMTPVGDKGEQESEVSSSLQLTPTSTAWFVTESDSQSIHQISAKTEIDHGSASGEGADANHEAETASQAAAHLDSLDPLNPSVEQDDARRNASIRAKIKGLQKCAVIALFHIYLAFILLLTTVYLEIVLPEDDQAYYCGRPSMMALLNSVILLLSWETFVLIDLILIGDMGFRDIRYHDVEEIPDVRLTEVLNQLRFHRIRSIVTPLIAWIWFYGFASGPVAQFPIFYAKGICSAEELGRGGNSTTNATAVAFADSTSHVLLGAVKNATNATVKALMDAAAKD
ncbi:uncharacterized protein EAE97_011673 [Botrytis byssoidea]|uniref:Uncharacterized protein n=1 Tax=Botrytis byssoidea TaxID=139641 RepID=A0A9P5LQ22_9HELO|nr:uncharacterized protein EAE97_011673 [Botrytis byssoidea]KAF7919341.1 hypothetical protein EAE97_011673 [Botrytis byssoidea]